MSIYRLNSDLENKENFGKSLRLRKLEQKFLYMGEGADNYYNDGNVFSVDEGVINDIISHKTNFGSNIFKGLDLKESVLVSLGSGSADTEKKVFKKVGKDLDFIGVDSSDNMLKILVNNYKDVENKKDLIRADISSYEFLREIQEKTSKYKNKVFTFLGNTIGSIENTSIVDTLYGLLNKGDKIWIDVRLRGDGTMVDDMKLFNAYEKAYNSPSGKKFLMSKLVDLGITDDNANIKIKMTKEELTDSLRFTMSYVFNDKKTIDIKGKIIFLKGEVLDILSLHAFSIEGLINFYKEHGLKCVDYSTCNLRGQFLFEKE